MITEKEIQATRMSPTKKDFYQIWNELLDTAGKISERWDPSSTNESDPGIMLLKVLTGIADKLNYNIDKNILEAFMPSATQEESMRKLCEMMGYNIKYYTSAETEATISFIGASSPAPKNITIAAGAVLTNEDNDIIYTTTEDCTLFVDKDNTEMQQISSKAVPCIQGRRLTCETNLTDNKVTLALLDDNKRFILPEAQIAENGLYIYNSTKSVVWKKVDNLNTTITGEAVYKFGFDSKKQMPYVQFSEDIADLIGDGLIIEYIRTDGINGNISAKTLTAIESATINATSGVELTVDDFAVTNVSAAQNGTNIETINQAYNNYKKVIGTFDTLVTCRDYMNKIYQLTVDNIPLVSNIIVSDIRDDINKAYTLCEFGTNGIKYTDNSLATTNNTNGAGISNFDLILYPFKTVYGLNTKDEYINSFNYSRANLEQIQALIKNYKTISHNYISPELNEITCIKNYLKLNAKITTTYKVNSAEETGILSNIYKAIYTNFNARQVDFGEEIPFDTILSTIENADERIKNVSLEEPELFTAVQVLVDNSGTIKEYTLESPDINYKQAMNKLTLRNILAGRVNMFNYNTKFSRNYADEKYPSTDIPEELPEADKHIYRLDTSCIIPVSAATVTLTENEVISFRAPAYATEITYPAYVNYFAKIDISSVDAVPAEFMDLKTYFAGRAEALKDVDDTMMTTTVVDGSPKYTKSGTTYTKSTSGTYYINLISNTCGLWRDWFIKAKSGNNKIDNLYKQLSADASRVQGYLVDKQYYKYTPCSTLQSAAGKTSLELHFVPNTASADNEYGYGKDAELKGVPKDAEYTLGENECILFNYTETDSTTNTSNIVNKVYGEGTIIKPNFLLVDSATLYKQGLKYTKTTGYTFEQKVPGMYALGTNEQVEIRKLSEVKFYNEETKNTVANVYWTLQTDSTSKEEKSKFPFDANGRYTLKDNEYFYYTDQNKLDMAWYGVGTEIQVTGGIVLEKSNDDTEANNAEILDKGLAAIPWVTIYGLGTKVGDVVKNITIKEYQYINLTAGDQLLSITMKNTGDTTIDNSYKPCTKAKYQYAEASVSQDLPEIKVGETSWEVRSKLELNVGPDKQQTLYNERDKITVNWYNGTWAPSSSEMPEEKGTKEIKPKKVGTTVVPLVFKTNYDLQSSTAETPVLVTVYETDDKTIKEHKDDFAMKFFKYDTYLVDVGGEKIPLDLHNFGGVWTEIDGVDGKTTTVKLNTTIPADHFGLIMMYYEPAEESYTTGATIKPDAGTLGMYNWDKDDTWPTTVVAAEYKLREGINIVKLPAACKYLTLTFNDDKAGCVKISDLDVVPTDKELNPLITYYATAETTDIAQLKTDLRKIITGANYKFYYNTVTDNSIALDINSDLNETTETSRIFYDYNNVNNKFVISEISDKDMRSGITIARSSKL